MPTSSSTVGSCPTHTGCRTCVRTPVSTRTSATPSLRRRAREGAGEFLEEWATLLRRYERGYLHEGKHFATIAVGCTGGKHRSVVVAEQLAERLQLAGGHVRVVHRDLGRE